MRGLSIIVLFLLIFAKANTATLLVGPTGDYVDIESAAIDVMPGDSIVVQDGIYTIRENLTNVQGSVTDTIYILAANLHQAIYRGNSQAWHITDGAYLKIIGFVFENQTANGVNIDDGGSYDTPSHHIVMDQCIFRDMNVSGNHDLLKLSGLDHFVISNCQFINGSTGGSGIDMVGCHNGLITGCLIDDGGVTGIQAKGGTQFIRIEKNILKNMAERALNLGGSTDLIFFRPPLPNPIVDAFEAADLDVFSNIFIGSRAPIAYVGSVRVRVYNNTLYYPDNWVMRILQETTEPGFLPCSDNEFKNNIIYLADDLTEVNIGSNTSPATFQFSNNLWFNENDNGSWSPSLPVTDVDQVIDDPLFFDAANEDFNIPPQSPAVQAGTNTIDPVTDFENMAYDDPRSIGAHEGFDTALPVNYLAFDAKQVDRGILLRWVTELAYHVSHYEIWHSTNNTDWNKKSEIRYNPEKSILYWLDNHPKSGINYYKIIASDEDRTQTISPIIPVVYLSNDPSVFAGQGLLYIQYPEKERVLIQLYNISGQLLYHQFMDQISEAVLPVHQWSSSVIIVQLTTVAGTKSYRRLIQR